MDLVEESQEITDSEKGDEGITLYEVSSKGPGTF